MTPQAWEFSAVTLLQGQAVLDSATLGHDHVNLSTGPDTPKIRWSEKLIVNPEFILTPDRPFSRLAFSAYWQASAAAALRRERHRHKALPAAAAASVTARPQIPGLDGPA
jgi:hypothetical protein